MEAQMADTENLVAHLANLSILLDYYDKIGGERNRWVVREFEEGNARLLETLKEKFDETRTRDVRPGDWDEAGTELPRGLSGRSGPAGPEGGDTGSGGTAIRRPRA